MNRVVHFEIHARDMEAVQKFYEDVFGWEIKNMGPEYGNYRMVVTGPALPQAAEEVGINGGITPRNGGLPTGEEAVNAFICTMQVDDIDASIARVSEAGGSISMDKMDVPNVGLLAYCKDPEGNLFGMLQPTMTPPA